MADGSEAGHDHAHEHGQNRGQNGAKVTLVKHDFSLYFLFYQKLVVGGTAGRVNGWVFSVGRVSRDPAEGEDVSQ